MAEAGKESLCAWMMGAWHTVVHRSDMLGEVVSTMGLIKQYNKQSVGNNSPATSNLAAIGVAWSCNRHMLEDVGLQGT